MSSEKWGVVVSVELIIHFHRVPILLSLESLGGSVRVSGGIFSGAVSVHARLRCEQQTAGRDQ